MSKSYNGRPALVTALGGPSILSSTNATPIVVTADAAHGLMNGDFVHITGHATNTAANGIRRVTVLTATTFSLQTPDTGANVAGVGVGGATGTVTPFKSQALSLPDDGDASAAASWNLANETLGDRSAWAFYRLKGARVLAQQKLANTTDVVSNAAWTGGTTYAATTWTPVTNVDEFVSFPGDLDVVSDDLVEFEFTSAYVSSGTAEFSFALFAHAYDYGAAPAFASATQLSGSSVYYGPSGITPTFRISWSGFASAFGGPASGGDGKAVRLYLAAYNRSGAGSVVDLFGDRRYVAKVWR